jgi:thiosulfate reductase cytochrome b subunit
MDKHELIEHPPREDAQVDLVGQVLARLPDRTRNPSRQRLFMWVMLGFAVGLGLLLGLIFPLQLGIFPRLPGLMGWQAMTTVHFADAVIAVILTCILAAVLGRRPLV